MTKKRTSRSNENRSGRVREGDYTISIDDDDRHSEREDDEIDIDPGNLSTGRRSSDRPNISDVDQNGVPFFQEHIYYDDDKSMEVTSCCSCLPYEVRTRMDICGKKLCSPRMVVSMSLLILFSLLSAIFFFTGFALLIVQWIDYPKMELDPNALAYIHRNCCLIHTSYIQEISSDVSRYDMIVKVPIMGFSNFSTHQNNLRGYDMECQYYQLPHRVFHYIYEGSPVSEFTNNSMINCYTNNEENMLQLLEPYSNMYHLFRLLGITSATASGVLMCLGFSSFLIACMVLRKKKKGVKSTWLFCCCC